MTAYAAIAEERKVSSNVAHSMRLVRRALLEHGFMVTVGETTFRHLTKGQSFDDGEETIEALGTGIFVRFPKTRAGEPAGHAWCFMGSTELVDEVVGPFLGTISEQARDDLSVQLAARAALRSIALDRTPRRGPRI